MVSSVTWDGQQTVTCISSGGPPTQVVWRRNCTVIPNNSTTQNRVVTDAQRATYNNTLVIDPGPGVYNCSVSNIRGYSNGVVGVGGKCDVKCSTCAFRIYLLSMHLCVSSYIHVP